jgi:hypothetical protein
MVIGPLTATDFQILKERLDEVGLPYGSFVDQAIQESPRHKIPLLSFDEWREARRLRRRTHSRVLSVLSILCHAG